MSEKIGGKKLAGKNWRENVGVAATVETGEKRRFRIPFLLYQTIFLIKKMNTIDKRMRAQIGKGVDVRLNDS